MQGGAVVTGAGRGLGLAIARRLVRRGHSVVLADVDGDAARRAAEGLGARGVELDVRDAEAVGRLAAEVGGTDGGLAVWVNNAGVFPTGPAWDVSPDQARSTVDVNLLGLVNGTTAALREMRRQGHGHVLNLVSLAGIVVGPGQALYAATKHAALAFSTGAQLDLRVDGVRGLWVSALCPDGVWTPMLHVKTADPWAAASWTGRMLDAEQVADAAESLLDRPRPVLTVPRHRGPLMRVLAGLPRFATMAAPAVMAQARRRQQTWAAANPVREEEQR